LYEWTKKTVDDPAKKAKYLKSFTLYVAGQEVYEKDKADALEAELKPLVGGPIVANMFKYDTDPAHNPQPPPQGKRKTIVPALPDGELCALGLGSVRLDARELDPLGPFVDIFGDELGELVRRVRRHRHGAEIGEPLLDVRVE